MKTLHRRNSKQTSVVNYVLIVLVLSVPRFGMGPQILKRFDSCTLESILTGCITAWYGNCLTSDRKELQRIVRMAQDITGAELHAILDLYTRRCQRKALKMVKDSSHPSHRLFSLLPHNKRYQVWNQQDAEQHPPPKP